MARASSTSCAEVSSGILPISRRYMRTGSSTVWSMVTSRSSRNSSSSEKSSSSSSSASTDLDPHLAEERVDEVQFLRRQVGVVDDGPDLLGRERPLLPRLVEDVLEHLALDALGAPVHHLRPPFLRVEVRQAGADACVQLLQTEQLRWRCSRSASPPWSNWPRSSADPALEVLRLHPQVQLLEHGHRIALLVGFHDQPHVEPPGLGIAVGAGLQPGQGLPAVRAVAERREGVTEALEDLPVAGVGEVLRSEGLQEWPPPGRDGRPRPPGTPARWRSPCPAAARPCLGTRARAARALLPAGAGARSSSATLSADSLSLSATRGISSSRSLRETARSMMRRTSSNARTRPSAVAVSLLSRAWRSSNPSSDILPASTPETCSAPPCTAISAGSLPDGSSATRGGASARAPTRRSGAWPRCRPGRRRT